jgi:poly(hydroxyalkanoate) granule-associated protein
MATKKTAKKTTQKTAAKAKNGSAAADMLRRPFLISVGALALVEEQASSMIDSLVKRGEKARKAGEKYLKKLNKKVAEKPKKQEKVEKKTEEPETDWYLRALEWLNLPTRDDVDQLNKRIDALMRKVA